MVSDTGMFQAIQEALPEIFKGSDGVLTMREARPLIENALQNRGFDAAELHREVYRHIHQSCVNVVGPRAAYKGVGKILWNESDRTFRLLSEAELRDIAAGIPPSSTVGLTQSDEVSKKAQLIARESIVRDYVARNLSQVEAGLSLWNSSAPAVEHPIANRRIDIFAKDASGIPVIIELKLHRAHDRVVGQVLLYRSLVRKYHSVQRVRIILIAERISKELHMAAEEVGDMQMLEYRELNLKDEHELGLNLTLNSTFQTQS